MNEMNTNIRVHRRPVNRRPNLQLSFEFFPPKTEAMEARFWETLNRLAPLDPQFVSVTYGAGGSTRERTLRMVSEITKQGIVPAAGHLTCVSATRAEVDEVIRGYWEAGVRRIVALRGDPAGGIGTTYEPYPGGYANAAELVAGVRKIGDFDVSVAAYPERHPESPDWDADIDNLKRKLDAGAERAITQMFFDNALYWRFVERVRKAGITAPIVPGIQPIHNFRQISSFAAKCGATIPGRIAERFAGIEEDSEAHARVAEAVVAEQVSELVDCGVNAFHVYTMNRSRLAFAVARVLGRKPA